MKKRVLVPFTTGVEEIEFTAIVDILGSFEFQVGWQNLLTLEKSIFPVIR